MRRADDAKAAIMSAARAAFASDGDIDMNDVARRANVSVELAYRYFRSKARLLTAVIRDFFDRYDAAANARVAPELNWAQRERRRLQRVAVFLFSDPLAPAILNTFRGDGEIAALDTARRRALVDRAAERIRSAQSAQELAPDVDADLAAAFVVSGVREAAARALADPEEADADRFVDQMWPMIEGALRLGAARASRYH